VDVLQVASTVGAVGAAAGVVGLGARWAGRKWAKVDEFLEDWNGTPARPGVDARPGAMERLDRIEDGLIEIRKSLAAHAPEEFPWE
jgi:hypothetical protein